MHESAGQSANIPVIPITESSTMLDRLLRICYPVASPILDSFEDVRQLLEAGRKYDMPLATQAAIRRLRELAETKPVAAWTIAMRQDLPAEARYAARMSLRQPLLSDAVDPEELLHVSARDYHRLMAYHRACARAAVQFVDKRPPTSTCRYCNGRWETWGLAEASALLARTPGPENLITMTLACAKKAATECSWCAREAVRAVEPTLEHLTRDVERVIGEVGYSPDAVYHYYIDAVCIATRSSLNSDSCYFM
jgi:hypothetical protein